MSNVEECNDSAEKEASSTITDGAQSIWLMVMREGSGFAMLSLSASVMLMSRVSSDLFGNDCPKNAAFSQSAESSR